MVSRIGITLVWCRGAVFEIFTHGDLEWGDMEDKTLARTAVQAFNGFGKCGKHKD